MATSDQLRKAERYQGLALNDYTRAAYIHALEAAGQTDVRRLSKVEAWYRVREAGIVMVPSWRASAASAS